MKQPIDILVLTYNRIEYLKAFIEFLYLSTNYPFNLIVIDNGSIDGSREFIIEMKEKGLVYDYIFNKENLPLGAAFTEGFKKVKSKLFLTVADDMRALLFKEPDWLRVFIAKMEQDSSVGCINMVGCRCLFGAFNRKTRPLIYKRIQEEGGERLEIYNKMQKLIYGK